MDGHLINLDDLMDALDELKEVNTDGVIEMSDELKESQRRYEEYIKKNVEE